jgi:hypothetical protein
LGFVSKSPQFGDSAKISAKEMAIHLDDMWNGEAFSWQKQ